MTRQRLYLGLAAVPSLLLGLTVVGVSMMGGCDHTMYVLFGGEQKVDVAAEYNQMKSGKLAVMIYMPPDIASDYPYAEGQITDFVANEFNRVIREGQFGKLELIDAVTVRDYQESKLNWQGMPRTQIARELGADYLLMVSVMEFTTREYGDTADLFRGQLLASATLYDASLEEYKAAVWPGATHDATFSEVYPEHGPIGQLSSDDTVVRRMVFMQLADKLAKRFYDHTVVIKDDDPKNRPS
ncbi:MAG: hypothetical protein ACLFUJ_15065 [Phycisphaerae bacterium]